MQIMSRLGYHPRPHGRAVSHRYEHPLARKRSDAANISPPAAAGPALRRCDAMPRRPDSGPEVAPEPVSASRDDGSMTGLYVDVMHAAVRRRDAWGSLALLGDSMRGLGVLAILLAPVGLPCAALADAARFGGRWLGHSRV